MRLYRVSDVLMAHREAIENHLFERVTELFSLKHTVTLYDLTNTFFEGEAQGQPKARRGHSKEKRSDCPLLTLGCWCSTARASCAAPKCLPAMPTKTRPWRPCSRLSRRPPMPWW